MVSSVSSGGCGVVGVGGLLAGVPAVSGAFVGPTETMCGGVALSSRSREFSEKSVGLVSFLGDSGAKDPSAKKLDPKNLNRSDSFADRPCVVDSSLIDLVSGVEPICSQSEVAGAHQIEAKMVDAWAQKLKSDFSTQAQVDATRLSGARAPLIEAASPDLMACMPCSHPTVGPQPNCPTVLSEPHSCTVKPSVPLQCRCTCVSALSDAWEAACSQATVDHRQSHFTVSRFDSLMSALSVQHGVDDAAPCKSRWHLSRAATMFLHMPDAAVSAYLFYTVAHGFKITDDLSLAKQSCVTSCGTPKDSVGQATLDRRMQIKVKNGSLRRWVDVRGQCGLSTADRPLKVSPLFWVAKSDVPTSEEVRDIVHLSCPKGFSCNDLPLPSRLPREMRLPSVQTAADLTRGNSWMAKEDLRWGYTNIPVHVTSWTLLGIYWRGEFWVQIDLPFGLVSAPRIFSQVSCAIRDEVLRLMPPGLTDVQVLCYLDDYFIHSTSKTHTTAAVALLVATCADLGLEIHQGKSVRPGRVCEWLGVTLDVDQGLMYLSEPRCIKLSQALESVLGRKKATRHSLEKLLGRLNWAARVVHGGFTFMRSLINTSTKVSRAGHLCTLTAENLSDLGWWAAAVQHMKGVPLHAMHGGRPVVPVSHNMTDACGGEVGHSGAGGFFNGAGWCAKFTAPQCTWDINMKELMGGLWQLERYASTWAGHRVMMGMDNQVSVGWIGRLTARPPCALLAIKRIWWICQRYDIELVPVHIPGVENDLADALSRYDFDRYAHHLNVWSAEHTVLKGRLKVHATISK